MRPLTGAVGEATALKLKDLNLYLHSVQQVTLNQILQILNLLHHSTSNLYTAESYSDSGLVCLRFMAPLFSEPFRQTDSTVIIVKGLWQQAAKIKRK